MVVAVVAVVFGVIAVVLTALLLRQNSRIEELLRSASEQMKNVDGTSHRWTVDEIRLATNNEIISKGTTIGDILYLANMAYADFYPKVIKTESDCVQYAIAVASDPDGYEGMAFCRWTADIIGKGVTIDWEKLE